MRPPSHRSGIRTETLPSGENAGLVLQPGDRGGSCPSAPDGASPRQVDPAFVNSPSQSPEKGTVTFSTPSLRGQGRGVPEPGGGELGGGMQQALDDQGQHQVALVRGLGVDQSGELQGGRRGQSPSPGGCPRTGLSPTLPNLGGSDHQESVGCPPGSRPTRKITIRVSSFRPTYSTCCRRITSVSSTGICSGSWTRRKWTPSTAPRVSGPTRPGRSSRY